MSEVTFYSNTFLYQLYGRGGKLKSSWLWGIKFRSNWFIWKAFPCLSFHRTSSNGKCIYARERERERERECNCQIMNRNYYWTCEQSDVSQIIEEHEKKNPPKAVRFLWLRIFLIHQTHLDTRKNAGPHVVLILNRHGDFIKSRHGWPHNDNILAKNKKKIPSAFNQSRCRTLAPTSERNVIITRIGFWSEKKSKYSWTSFFPLFSSLSLFHPYFPFLFSSFSLPPSLSLLLSPSFSLPLPRYLSIYLSLSSSLLLPPSALLYHSINSPLCYTPKNMNASNFVVLESPETEQPHQKFFCDRSQKGNVLLFKVSFK